MSVYYRNAFFEIEQLKDRCGVACLLAPVRSGKSWLLQQLKEKHGGYYFNFKNMEENEQKEAINEILKAVSLNESVDFYVDDITYLHDFARRLAEIQEEATKTIANANYFIVITGNNEMCLQTAMSLAFGARAHYVEMDYISFSEYYAYLHGNVPQEVSEKDYLKYAYTGDGFNCIKSSLDEYIDNCLMNTRKALSNYGWLYRGVDICDIEADEVIQAACTIATSILYEHLGENLRSDTTVNYLDSINDMPIEKVMRCVRFLKELRIIDVLPKDEQNSSYLNLRNFEIGKFENWKDVDSFINSLFFVFVNVHFFVKIIDSLFEKSIHLNECVKTKEELVVGMGEV